MAEHSSQTLPSNQDFTSPYYLHPTDNTASQLVSIKFNGEGFGDWKRCMLISISSKNKLGFIDGSIPEPMADEKFYSAWKRCNDLMISWILFNLDPTIAKSVLYLPTAKEIWDDLEERYGYVSAPQLYSLQQQVSEFVQGSKSVAEFFTEIKGIWDKISEACPLPTMYM